MNIWKLISDTKHNVKMELTLSINSWIIEEYVFAISHMFFHDKAWTKKEALERMKEKKSFA